MESAVELGEFQRETDPDAEQAANLFRKFLMSFTVNDVPIYLNQVRSLVIQEKNTLFVNFADISSFNERLAHLISQCYYKVHESLGNVMVSILTECEAAELDVEALKSKRFHVAIENFARKQNLRDLRSALIGRLARINGQVVRTYPVHPELCKGYFVCLECNAIVEGITQQFKYTQPLQCVNSMCQNRSKFKLDLKLSVFTDFQKVRIQEMQNELPRGSVPRSIDVIIRGEIVERCQPGDRIDFIGTLIAIPDVSQLSTPGAQSYKANSRRKGAEGYEVEGLRGLKSLGVRDLNFRLAFLVSSMMPVDHRAGGERWYEQCCSTPEFAKRLMSEEEFSTVCRMRSNVNLYNDLLNSLFPTIHGNDEIKRGILLMLFGGIPKRTKEGTSLRGDINICVVGDPSTGKSQLLRQVESFCPRAVYTSGRTSSAAGLTAAVVRDEESFEFVIEAGALMLADNGICCIDEFDKMETKDQVAIHEAMEQQTISITKAGVKATLNARTSILAAANPVGGQYDRAKSLRQNINLSAPILSRFDLFFVLIDDGDEAVDYSVAQRITDLHMKNFESVRRPYSIADVQRYVMFARLWMPKLTEEAGEYLVDNYKRLRMRDNSAAAFSSWRITVRQLESLIRLSEAVCRMYCSDLISVNHVKEAARLLNKSIIRVEQPDVDLQSEHVGEGNQEEADVNMEEEEEALEVAPTRSLKISFEEYKSIARILVIRLRSEDEREDSSESAGVKFSDLVSWFLEEKSDTIESEEELVRLKDIVEKVINRLIRHDNVLIALSSIDADESLDSSDPFLVVHPNYILEEE